MSKYPTERPANLEAELVAMREKIEAIQRLLSLNVQKILFELEETKSSVEKMSLEWSQKRTVSAPMEPLSKGRRAKADHDGNSTDLKMRFGGDDLTMQEVDWCKERSTAGHSDEEIGKMIGRTRRYVQDLLYCSKFNQVLRDLVDERVISLTNARKAVKLNFKGSFAQASKELSKIRTWATKKGRQSTKFLIYPKTIADYYREKP